MNHLPSVRYGLNYQARIVLFEPKVSARSLRHFTRRSSTLSCMVTEAALRRRFGPRVIPVNSKDTRVLQSQGELPTLRFVDRFESDGNVFYAEEIESHITLWKVTGEVEVGRAILNHDAVIYNECIVRPEYHDQYGTVDLYHDHAGRKGSVRVDRVLDEPVQTLEEVDRL